jgi:hypothetical protein
LSRRPDRSRSRRIVFAVAVFLAVVVTGNDDNCGPPSTTQALATLSLLPRLMGVLGRGVVLIAIPDHTHESGCPPS